jgi:serine/threonine-protein kinase
MNSCAHCGAPFTPVISGQTLCDRCQGLMHPEPSSPLQQAEVAGFRLLHELGAGRFSHSWLGEDYRSHAVVVKLLRRYAPDADAVQRFVAEAERLATSAGLDHPNLARPLSAGVHLVQALFLVYQGGGELTLADELRQRGRVLPSRALELCAQICEGLAALHREGVLHLDLKPANVGLTRLSDGTEQAVVLDAATSHLLAHVGLRDGGDLPLSTAAYTAPEQAGGQGADERSDLYSVGVLLFQLVSGRLPVMGASSAELLRAHLEHAVLRLQDVGRRVHPELEDAIARLTARDPAQRPQNGDEAAVMLRSLAALAEAAPVEDALESDEDPLALPPRSEVISAPPQMLPPAVDPGLERAMLGHVPPQRESRFPGWTASLRQRRWQAFAGIALVLALVPVLLFRARHPSLQPVAAVPPTPARIAVAEALTNAADLAATPTAPTPEAEPPRPSKLAQKAASPWAKNFDRAQKSLWTNRPSGAQTILRDILKKPDLSRRDRARASRMMGDAEAKRGNRSGATQWWRKSFQLYDDPEERAKVARLIQASR